MQLYLHKCDQDSTEHCEGVSFCISCDVTSIPDPEEMYDVLMNRGGRAVSCALSKASSMISM